jgi:hypothetical protein
MNRRRRLDEIDETINNIMLSFLNPNVNNETVTNSFDNLFSSMLNTPEQRNPLSSLFLGIRSSFIPPVRQPRSGISRLVNPESFLCSKRYEDYQYQKAKEQYLTKIKRNNPENFVSRSILNLILDIYTDNEDNDEYPLLEELVDKVYDYRCPCVYFLSELDIKNLLKDYIADRGDIPKCQEYAFLIEYHILNKTIPTEDQLEEFMQRTIEFTFNPEDFYHKDKIHVPAIGVDKLPVTEYCKDTCKSTTCSLCQEDFEDKQKIITLLPCKHEFHYNEKNCLESASIKTWLNNNNFCPLCKTKVEIK